MTKTDFPVKVLYITYLINNVLYKQFIVLFINSFYYQDEVNDTVMDKLILPSNDARRRVSFGDENISIKEYDMLADRRKSDGMGYDMGNRHSYR